jgi:hypothetical protein
VKTFTKSFKKQDTRELRSRMLTVGTLTCEVRRYKSQRQTSIDLMRGFPGGPPAARWHVQVVLWKP